MHPILPHVARGDSTAVDACIREYGGMVWRLASQYLGSHPQDVEDAVQEIFVDVWMSAHRFDPAKGSEPGFIATIAHRRLIDRRRRLPRRAAEQIAVALEAAANHTDAPDAGLSMATAVRQLSADEQQALLLSVGRGLSHREIAVATSVPVGTVKTRLRRAVARLQETLGISPMARTSGGGA